MITVKNNLFTKLSVNSIYTFPKETTNEDIINMMIHDIIIGLCGFVKEYGDSLRVNDIPISLFNTFKYVWGMNDNNSLDWECIYENKSIIDLILSEVKDLDDKSKEVITNLFPKDKLTVFHIFKNSKQDDSHIFATYNILCYNR